MPPPLMRFRSPAILDLATAGDFALSVQLQALRVARVPVVMDVPAQWDRASASRAWTLWAGSATRAVAWPNGLAHALATTGWLKIAPRFYARDHGGLLLGDDGHGRTKISDRLGEVYDRAVTNHDVAKGWKTLEPMRRLLRDAGLTKARFVANPEGQLEGLWDHLAGTDDESIGAYLVDLGPALASSLRAARQPL